MKNYGKKLNIYKACVLIFLTVIISGCSSSSKKDKLISVQKNRISKLRKHIERQKSEISRLKFHRISRRSPREILSTKAKALRKLMASKQWVEALQLSSSLKKQFPRSKRVRRHRIEIFYAMGLNRQARGEATQLKKLVAGHKNRSIKR